jgi:nicotinate-nucleotide adenylyltransferase
MVELEQIKEWAKLIPQARIEILDVPSLPLSSTMIRQWVSQGRSIWYTTPWNVQQMIYKNGYYLKPGQATYKHEAPPLAEVRRVGIYPGAFDPITYGDLLKAEWARQELDLDRIDFVASGQLPNKRTVHASAENRGDWVVAATADNPYFNAWRTDVESGRVSYTLQTVEDAQRRYGKDVELFVLIRAEYLNPSHPLTLSKWMGAEQLFKMCRFIAFPRDWTQIEKAQQWAKRIPNANIDVVYAPSIPIESNFVRELVGQGHSTMYCTPWDVQQLITKSGDYGADKVTRRRSR